VRLRRRRRMQKNELAPTAVGTEENGGGNLVKRPFYVNKSMIESLTRRSDQHQRVGRSWPVDEKQF
jgi:hypothetical protein